LKVINGSGAKNVLTVLGTTHMLQQNTNQEKEETRIVNANLQKIQLR
jgi:hypothetical protein